MLHDRRQRHGERLRKLADRSRSAGQPLDHHPSAGVGKRLEHEIERGRLVKHMLKYHR
jgi:hypothetical protein